MRRRYATMPHQVTIKFAAKPPWTDAPGSLKAISEGCTCSEARNNFGRGFEKNDARRWYPTAVCPIHGLGTAVLKRRGKKKPAADQPSWRAHCERLPP